MKAPPLNINFTPQSKDLIYSSSGGPLAATDGALLLACGKKLTHTVHPGLTPPITKANAHHYSREGNTVTIPHEFIRNPDGTNVNLFTGKPTFETTPPPDWPDEDPATPTHTITNEVTYGGPADAYTPNTGIYRPPTPEQLTQQRTLLQPTLDTLWNNVVNTPCRTLLDIPEHSGGTSDRSATDISAYSNTDATVDVAALDTNINGTPYCQLRATLSATAKRATGHTFFGTFGRRGEPLRFNLRLRATNYNDGFTISSCAGATLRIYQGTGGLTPDDQAGPFPQWQLIDTLPIPPFGLHETPEINHPITLRASTIHLAILTPTPAQPTTYTTPTGWHREAPSGLTATLRLTPIDPQSPHP